MSSVADDVMDPNAMQSMTFPVPKLLSKAHEQYVAPPTHIAYATTWFSLSAVACYIAFKMHRGSSVFKTAVSKSSRPVK